MVSMRSVERFLPLPRPKMARRPSKPALTMQQKQRRMSSMMPAITPMTIPAIAPGLRPPPLAIAIVVGKALPLAVAGARKGAVVVAEPVVVIIPVLVGRRGGVYDAPVVGTGTGTTGKKDDSGLAMQEFVPPHCWLDAQQIVPHEVCP